MIHAIFDGKETTQTVDESLAGKEEKVVTFSTPIDFSAPTEDRKIDYTIFTTLNGEDNVYRKNDTIAKSITSKYTAMMPDSFVYQGNYSFPYIVLPEKDRSEHISSYELRN